jgi:hypothetical protein
MRKTVYAVSLSLALTVTGAGLNASVRPDSNVVQSVRTVYRTYANARFKYSISYPAGLLAPQGEAENGDGQAFRSKDGSAEMRVWGQNNFDNKTLRASFQEAVGEAGDGVTYKVIRGNWFVVSSVSQGKIHYQKTMLHGDVFKTFLIDYDEGKRATYDPITARIAKSFVG